MWKFWHKMHEHLINKQQIIIFDSKSDKIKNQFEEIKLFVNI